MKKCISLLLLGFSLHLAGKENSGGKIEGSGTVITDERSLNNFTGIRSEGSFEVVITQDASQKVVVKTDDNIMPYVQTEVSEGKLRIFFSDRYNNYRPTSATVYISSSLIEDIDLSGSGTIRATNQLRSRKPHYSVKGSGKMNLSVAAETIETSIAGSGSIDLKGSAASARHSITGSGNTNALAFASPDVKVKITGSGDCFVNAETSLDVSIGGSGNVQYKGAPRLTSNISGSGKVTRYGGK